MEEEIEKHEYVPDINEEGVAFVFTNTGGYVPCKICERDEKNEIHRVES